MSYIEWIDTLLLGEVSNIKPDKLKEAMTYSLFSGGKRLRGQLCLATAELFSNFALPALPFASAIESIHTYSLIHDDLPALDNDDLRRGKATNHKIFGEATAILAGDGLLNLAYEIMTKSVAVGGQNEFLALSYVARQAGAFGMIAGQMMDLQSETKKITEEELLTMYELKTGGLWKASFVCGGLLGNASETDVLSLEKLGNLLGIAYQIKDDILEQTTTENLLGKSVLSDRDNNKQTSVTFWGLEKAIMTHENMWQEIYEIVDTFQAKDSKFATLLKNMEDRIF